MVVHKLETCEICKKKSSAEKLDFIRQKKLCENCCLPFYFSTWCKRKQSCNIPECMLRRQHVSSLHEAIVAFEMKRKQKLGTAGLNQPLIHAVSGNSTQFAGSLSEAGAGYQCKSLSIVLFKVRGKGEVNEVITYALWTMVQLRHMALKICCQGLELRQRSVIFHWLLSAMLWKSGTVQVIVLRSMTRTTRYQLMQ